MNPVAVSSEPEPARMSPTSPTVAAAPQPSVHVAYLGNFTLDLLPREVEKRAAAEGLRATGYVGRFGQHVQELLESGGALATPPPDVALLALSLPLLRPEALAGFAALSADGRRALRDEVLAHVGEWARLARERLPATLVIANFVAPARLAAGVADARLAYGEARFYLDLNLGLLEMFAGDPRVQVLDLDRLAARFGKDRVRDSKLFYLARMEWSPAFLPLVAEELVRHLRAARGLARKCLVLDLDNTLWGGVVGEDGPAGVRVGPGDPVSEAFLDFQRRVKALQSRGVLLALCSKNNPADVREVFAVRPEMPLRLADFAAVEVSWEPKHEGLRRIAAELNIGLDALVFLDDNPAEVSLIEQQLPAVKAVALPADPALYVGVLDGLTDFEKAAILEDDLQKTDQYRQNRERRDLERQTGDLSDYLASLETELTLRRATAADLPRAHQLFTKTNQFNVTTRRYGLPELEAFAAGPDSELWLAAARDRFGDLGVIGACLLRRDSSPAGGGILEIDSFLLSCRALGRGIESAVMNHLKRRLAESGAAELRARFHPTPKNAPAAGFFEKQGFRLVAEDPDGAQLFALGRDEVAPVFCGWIAVRVE
ncbi:MAG TPA: HAD-IIIC family phosphatase [Thermoanaerobaculia bacterium]|nr:HAD-IIIC family phosphatase [Thermoanaerobaculia bacterium]